MMVQETKASSGDLERFRREAVSHGIDFVAHPATGEANARSGGVLVVWQRHLAVDRAPAFEASSRSVSVTLRSRSLGRVVLGSLYLHQGRSLHEGGPNDALLSNVFYPLRDAGTFALIGAD